MKIQNSLWFAFGLWFFMEPQSHPSEMTNRVKHHRCLTVVTVIHLTRYTEAVITVRLILTQLGISISQQRYPRNRQHGKTANKRIMAKAIKIISGRQQHPDPLTQPTCRINLPPVRSQWNINQNLVWTAAVLRASIKSLQRFARLESQRHECPTPKVNWTQLAGQKTTIYCKKWIKWSRQAQIFAIKRLARRQSKWKRVHTSSRKTRRILRHGQCLIPPWRRCLNATRKSSKFIPSLSLTKTTTLRISPSRTVMGSRPERIPSRLAALCLWIQLRRKRTARVMDRPRWHVNKFLRTLRAKATERVQNTNQFISFILAITFSYSVTHQSLFFVRISSVEVFPLVLLRSVNLTTRQILSLYWFVSINSTSRFVWSGTAQGSQLSRVEAIQCVLLLHICSESVLTNKKLLVASYIFINRCL